MIAAINDQPGDLGKITKLLGGPQVFQRGLRSQMDAHEMLLNGLPSKALDHLMENLVILKPSVSLERAVGMSLRTFQRRKHAPAKPLGQEQSGRTWKFAEILAKASDIFGSQEEAERWLDSPAIGLNQHRPIDLLATPAGLEMVEDYLTRIEYGVYS